jgi:CheY-like chemotaxis protein
MDMHMPKLTGLETLRQVRQHSNHLPCILISAGLNENILDEARQVKVFRVLSKPVTRVQVTEAVGMAMQQTYNWPRAG